MRADAVVVLADDSGPVGAVVVEVQLRPDTSKHWTWPMYLRLVPAALPEAARAHLEGLMATGTSDYQSEFTERLRTEGGAEAKAESVLQVLRVRGLEVPDGVRRRVMDCSDPEQLDLWLESAITVGSARDLFG